MAQKLLILSGLPGCGKTTFAKGWVSLDPKGRFRLNYDDLRREMFGPNWTFNFEDEEKMKAVAKERAIEALKAGRSVVIDNTNLTDGRIDSWRQLANTLGVEVEVRKFDVPLFICVGQDRLRTEGYLGRAIIEGMALRHGRINWNDTTLYGYEPKFVICDIDGTIADLSHRKGLLDRKCTNCGLLNPPITKDGRCGNGLLDPTKALKSGGLCGGEVTKKKWEEFFRKVGSDAPIQKIVQLLHEFKAIGYHILMVSGRPEDKAGVATETWLEAYGIPYEHLFLRKGGDRRDDDIIKEEILKFLPKERIAFVLDDRDRVVEMWRRNGLTCLQVAKGDF